MNRPHLFVEQFETVPEPNYALTMLGVLVVTICAIGAVLVAFGYCQGVL